MQRLSLILSWSPIRFYTQNSSVDWLMLNSYLSSEIFHSLAENGWKPRKQSLSRDVQGNGIAPKRIEPMTWDWSHFEDILEENMVNF